MGQDDSALELYLAEARSSSVVLPDEAEVLARARAGDSTAKRDLISSYLSLTAELGLRLAPDTLSKIEAIQEANLVLMRIIASGESPAVALGPQIAQRFDEIV